MSSNNYSNLETLQLLLLELPECRTEHARQGLLTLIYNETVVVVRASMCSLMRKYGIRKDRRDINELAHDAATKVIERYQKRPEFSMQRVHTYIYLVARATLFSYQDKKYNERTVQLHDGDNTDFATALTYNAVFYGDKECEEDKNLAALFSDLGLNRREFLVYFGSAMQSTRNMTDLTRFKKAVEATRHIVPRRFYYVHLDGLTVLQRRILS